MFYRFFKIAIFFHLSVMAEYHNHFQELILIETDNLMVNLFRFIKEGTNMQSFEQFLLKQNSVYRRVINLNSTINLQMIYCT